MELKNWRQLYNEENNNELRKLQHTILDIMKLFVSICDKYNLRYFLVGGTMLGAVRHQGFIPWDDDVDLGMPRPDYDRFIDIVKNELPKGYEFLNYKTSVDYKRYFSRIVDSRVEIYNASNSREIVENAWIDIFPYDGMPQNKLCQKIHFWHMTAWRLLYHASCFEELVNLHRPGRPKYQQLIINFLHITKLGHQLNTKKIMRRIEKGLCRYDYDKSETVVSFFGAYLTKEIVDKSLFGNLTYYTFEDSKFLGAEHSDEFLTHFYGDWQTIPDDKQKDKHNIRQIVYKQEM